MREALTPPSWIVERITALGGVNCFGKPNFRVVWGGSRTRKVGGMFKHTIVTDGQIIGQKIGIVTQVPEIRDLLAYHPERWHLEKWLPPEAYGSREEFYERTWVEEAQLHGQGDYPSEGDYEHVFYLAECPHVTEDHPEWCNLCIASSGQYIPLEENIGLIELQIRMLQMSAEVSKDDERVALFKRETDRREATRTLVAERVRNAMRPKLATQPTSWQPGTNSRTSVPEANFFAKPLYLPKNKRGFSQSDTAMPALKQAELDKE